MKPTYALGALINCVTLAIGLTIGFLAGTAHVRSVYAQATQVQQSTQEPQAQVAQGQEFEDVTPMMIMGSAAVHTLLAHRIATDQLMANGYDILLLNDGILNLLQQKHVATYREAEAIVERAKVQKPLRLKMPQPPAGQKPAPPSSPNK